MSDKKPKRMEPYTREWELLANQEARRFSPPIIPCVDCGAPVVKGYCCWRCKSVNPEARND